MNLRILSFDSNGDSVSVALTEAGAVVAHAAENTAVSSKQIDRQSVQTKLMPLIVECVDKTGWKKDSIDCIVVGIGPGSFTGIRTAVVTARTLAQALQLPLVGISLFDCYAFSLKNKVTNGSERSSAELAVHSERAGAKAARNEAAGALKYNSENGSERSAAELAVHSERAGAKAARNEAAGALTIGLILAAGKGNYFVAFYAIGEDETHSCAAPMLLKQEQLKLKMNEMQKWFADKQAIVELAMTFPQLDELSKFDNTAILQAQVALYKLDQLKTDRHQIDTLKQIFPYNSVEPLYVREPSVTIKCNDGK